MRFTHVHTSYARPYVLHAPISSYWGALSNSTELTGNLEAWFIDFDGDRVGQGMTNAVKSFVPTGPSLSWQFMDSSVFASDDDIADAILQDQAWVAIVGESYLSSRSVCPIRVLASRHDGHWREPLAGTGLSCVRHP